MLWMKNEPILGSCDIQPLPNRVAVTSTDFSDANCSGNSCLLAPRPKAVMVNNPFIRVSLHSFVALLRSDSSLSEFSRSSMLDICEFSCRRLRSISPDSILGALTFSVALRGSHLANMQINNCIIELKHGIALSLIRDDFCKHIYINPCGHKPKFLNQIITP